LDQEPVSLSTYLLNFYSFAAGFGVELNFGIRIYMLEMWQWLVANDDVISGCS